MPIFTRFALAILGLLVATGCATNEGFYTPERDRYAVETSEDKVADDLPNVFLIGDSIMSGYFKQTKRLLAEEALVFRHPGNAGETRNGLRKIDNWLGDTKWDVIHFNWGLHDLCYRHPEATVYGKRDKIRGTISVPLAEYSENLEALVKRLKESGARLIFATITNIPDGEAGRFMGDDLKYNHTALDIMKKHGVAVNDLHTLTSQFTAEMYSKPGDVHFSGTGNVALAKKVAEAIRQDGLNESPTH